MRILNIVIPAILLAGCATTKPVEIQEVYIPQKTKVEVVDCDTKRYHKLINEALESDDPDKGLMIINYQWQLIKELYTCIENQRIEIRGKQ